MMNPNRELVEEFMALTEDSKEYHAEQSPPRRLLEQLYRDLEDTRRRCLYTSGAGKIAVVGLSNVGKSTLVNALLGFPVAAVRNGPCTASIIEFVHGQEYRIDGSSDSLVSESMSFPSLQALTRKLGGMMSHYSPASRRWHKLVVTLPCDLLSKGLILVDTPGFGAPGELGAQDDAAVTRFLKQDAARVFWVVTAEGNVGAREHAVFASLLAERCDDLIVTNADELTKDERARWEMQHRPQLSLQTNIYFVDAKIANAALANSDMEAWERSGVQDLIVRITDLAANPAAIETVGDKLERLGVAIAKRVQHEEFERVRSPLFSRTAAARLRSLLPDELKRGPWGRLFGE